MRDYDQFFEAKTTDTRYMNAIVSLAAAIAGVFKRYSRGTRKTAWRAISTGQGKKEVERLLLNPDLPVTRFRRITRRNFKEWMAEER